jgi:hypothetical protein
MRKKIKMSLGGWPPSNAFQIMDYAMGQRSLPGSGEGLDFFDNPTALATSAAPGADMTSLNPLGPNTVTSSAYGLLDKSLQPTMDMQPFIDANTPANSGTIGGSGMGMVHMGMGKLEQELAMPENEFDQAQQTITQAKKAANIFKRGRDAVQHARNVKKVADVANASSDVGSLLGNLGAQGAGEAAKQTAKTGVGQFIANAGASKFGSFLASGAGAAASAGVGLLGKGIQELDKKDGNYSKAGAMGGGALQGAAIGSALGPIGTVVGAGIGAAVGAAQRKKFIEQETFNDMVDKTNEKAADAEKDLAKRAVLQTYPTTGIRQQVYAHGGHTNDPDYLAEGGEMIQHAPGDLPKTDNNGSVTPVTKTIARINGDKHTAPSGGVGMEGDKSARIYSDQLYVSEELLAELSKL